MTTQTTMHGRRATPPSALRRSLDRLRQFFINRGKEAGYGVFFGTVFLLGQSPAYGLAIDDIRVLSRLGEPLVAEVAVTPAAGEVLERGCFRAPQAKGDLPGVGPVKLQLTRRLNTQVLSISGIRPMREPMSEFILQVKCPGAPTMIKTFLVMVDPPGVNDPQFPEEISQPANTTVFAAPGSGRTITRAAPSRAPITGDIAPGSRYQVQTGDMLSTIAARVSGRPDWSVWPIANHIYRTNPGAFLLGDPNSIAQGAVVFIPRLADVDMSAATGIRPANRSAGSNQTATQRPAGTVVAGTRSLTSVTSGPATAAQSRTTAATAAVASPQAMARTAAPLPTMQLSTTLLKESQLKMQLRLSE
ncbi:MAG: hypothetical protein HKM98_03425, partial [Gammaproteobacteria bacterium]|nr:hypothetical protein [Gammaproteobacteria bacterium]